MQSSIATCPTDIQHGSHLDVEMFLWKAVQVLPESNSRVWNEGNWGILKYKWSKASICSHVTTFVVLNIVGPLPILWSCSLSMIPFDFQLHPLHRACLRRFELMWSRTMRLGWEMGAKWQSDKTIHEHIIGLHDAMNISENLIFLSNSNCWPWLG